MIKHPTCKTCRYWIKPEEKKDYLDSNDFDERCEFSIKFGRCLRTPHRNFIEDWEYVTEELEEHMCRRIKSEYRDRTAASADASGYYSTFLCKQNHYCSMHSKLK